MPNPGSRLARVPPVVRIGTTDYAVTVGFADDKRAETLRGQIDYEHATIVLNGQLPDGRVAEVLMHEVIHGIDCEYGPLRLRESQIVALAKGVVAFLRMNPETAALMLEDGE